MQGSYYGEIPMSNEYVPVEAYAVDPRASSGSGTEGTYFKGIRIDWTTDESPGGITNAGWYTDNPDSPFFGYNEEQLVEDINLTGNADGYFSAWAADSGKNHEGFIQQIPGCWQLIS